VDRTRVVSPVFAGRSTELGHLERLIGGAAEGSPAVVLIDGEAGIGKSRLLQEVLDSRAPAGARRLVGQCSSFVGGAPPYAPIADALRWFLRSYPDAAGLLGGGAQALGILPSRSREAEHGIENLSAPWDQGRMLAELEATFHRVSELSPLILVIEDLHWADRSSLDFLTYLCHGLQWMRLAVLCTYRDDAADTPPLVGWLEDVRRHVRLTEIHLPPLTVPEAGQLIAGITGAADPELAVAVQQRSRGNPYYMEMLLSAMDTARRLEANDLRHGIPVPLRQVLLAPLRTLAAETRQVLEIVAAAGRTAAHDEVIAVSAHVATAELATLGGLREAVDRHILLAVDEPVGYSFRHQLTAEAVYEHLLPGERARLHLAWARALEEHATIRGRDDYAAASQIALHYHASGRPHDALGWDLRAADAAEQIGGIAEAAGCYRRMLNAWDQIADAEQRAGIDRLDLLLRVAHAEELAGDVTSVRNHIDQAVALVDPGTDPLRAAMLLDRKCWSLYIDGRTAESLDVAAEAVRLVPDAPPTLARVVALAGLGRVQTLVGQEELAASAAALAAAVAAQLHDHIGDALVAQLEARVAWQRGRSEAVALARHALTVAQRTGLQDLTMIAFDGLAEAEDAAGNDEGVVWACNEGYQQTLRLGGANYGAWLLCRACFTLMACGRFTDAADALNTALKVRASGILDVYGQLATALITTQQADYGAARAAIGRCRTGAPEPLPFSQRYCAAAAELELWAEDPGEAYAYACQGLAAVEGNAYRRQQDAGRLAWLAMRAIADRAQQARDRRDTAGIDQARADADQLLGRVADPSWLAAEPRGRVQAIRRLIDAELSRVLDRVGAEPWAHAAASAVSCNRPHMAAYAAWRQAEALLARRAPRQAAVDCVNHAYAMAGTIGAAPLQSGIDALARSARIQLRLPVHQQEPETVPPALQVLTDRERDILRLLADGLTNKQIAQRLYISPRTVGVHVSSILHKLGCTDRVQAAHLSRRIQRT
jgi:DNA-binding CsgD family transcriptional regulator